MGAGIVLSKGDLAYLVVIRSPSSDCAYVSDDYTFVSSHTGRIRLLSPLIPIAAAPKRLPRMSKKGGVHFFFTPSPQAKLRLVTRLQEIGGLCVFVTHGNAEVVALHNGDASLSPVRAVAAKLGVAVETWHVEKNEIVKVDPAPPSDRGKQPALDFAKVNKKMPKNNGYLEREFHSLMVRRHDGRRVSLRHVGPSVQQYIDQLEASLRRAKDDHAKLSEMWKFAGAHTYNVGQRFSGLSPILSSTCPTGGFEILGVGKALRAVESLGGFVFSRVEASGVYRKLALLSLGRQTQELTLPIPKHLNESDARELADHVVALREGSRVNSIERELSTDLAELEKKSMVGGGTCPADSLLQRTRWVPIRWRWDQHTVAGHLQCQHRSVVPDEPDPRVLPCDRRGHHRHRAGLLGSES